MLHVEKDNMKKEIDELRDENDYLHGKIRELETKTNLALSLANHNSQYSRRNNLRFFGIQEKDNENFIELICNLVKTKLNIPNFTADEIDTAHRVGEFDKSSDPKPRGIIVRFVRRTMRDRIVKNRRALAGSRMAITDDLTKANMQLLAAVKKHDSVENAWAQDCKIMVLMKTSSKIASVTSMAHLNENVEKWVNWKKKTTPRPTQEHPKSPQPGNPQETKSTNDPTAQPAAKTITQPMDTQV